VFLPKNDQFLKVPGSCPHHVPHVGFAAVDRSYCVLSVGKCNVAVASKIDNRFHFGIEAVNMPRLMIHGVGKEANAVEANGTRLDEA